jgi:hypothetical protein
MGTAKGKSTGRPERHSVDLSQYPDLVVIYLGMRANFPALIGMAKRPREQSSSRLPEATLPAGR